MQSKAAKGSIEPLYRCAFTPDDLREHPPVFTLPHKKMAYDMHCPDGPQRSGRVEVSRWQAAPPDERAPRVETVVEPIDGAFSYLSERAGAVEWWANFAAGDLFAYYADGCFAQDEIQVFEHPALASVREALRDQGRPTWVTEWGNPTPFLITGVERRYRVDVRPDASAGRPRGLYGKQFRRAPLHVALGAIQPIDPPTKSNIVVFEAPSHGAGAYLPEEIDFCLIAAHGAFRAAAVETQRIAPGAPCVIHTGFWGSGAYGGNPALMTAVQILAAQMAGVQTLVFATWEEPWRKHYDEGAAVAADVRREAPDLRPDRVVDLLHRREFSWGNGDGN